MIHYMLNIVGILAIIMLNNDGVMTIEKRIGKGNVIQEVCRIDKDGTFNRGKAFARLTCDQFKQQLMQMNDDTIMTCYTSDKKCSSTESKEK